MCVCVLGGGGVVSMVGGKVGWVSTVTHYKRCKVVFELSLMINDIKFKKNVMFNGQIFSIFV